MYTHTYVYVCVCVCINVMCVCVYKHIYTPGATPGCLNSQPMSTHRDLLSLSLPQLIEIVGRINVASSTCVHEFSRFFWRFCRTFGKIFTSTKVGALMRSTATSRARADNPSRIFVCSFISSGETAVPGNSPTLGGECRWVSTADVCR